MTKRIDIIVNRCNECPFLDCNSYDGTYICRKKFNDMLCSYVISEKDIHYSKDNWLVVEISIPEWCPLKDA